MNDPDTMWRDQKIVEHALDLSLAAYIECSLEPSKDWLPKRQTFQNLGEFNFILINNQGCNHTGTYIFRYSNPIETEHEWRHLFWTCQLHTRVGMLNS